MVIYSVYQLHLINIYKCLYKKNPNNNIMYVKITRSKIEGKQITAILYDEKIKRKLKQFILVRMDI